MGGDVTTSVTIVISSSSSRMVARGGTEEVRAVLADHLPRMVAKFKEVLGEGGKRPWVGLKEARKDASLMSCYTRQYLADAKKEVEEKENKKKEEQGRNEKEKQAQQGEVNEQQTQKEVSENKIEEKEHMFKPKGDGMLPMCPVCLDPMGPGARIYQCGAGHLVCQDCRPRIPRCPSRCGSRMTGRAIGMEQFLTDLA